jgi:hypothetical protein
MGHGKYVSGKAERKLEIRKSKDSSPQRHRDHRKRQEEEERRGRFKPPRRRDAEEDGRWGGNSKSETRNSKETDL